MTVAGSSAYIPRPPVGLGVRARYAAIWSLRQLARDERLLRSYEQQLLRRVEAQSTSVGSGSVLEPARISKSDLTPAVLQEVVARGRPAVIEGIQADSPAVSNWTYDSLKSRYGHCLVTALRQFVDETQPIDHYREEALSVRFAEAVDRMRGGEALYVPAMATLYANDERLLDDLQTTFLEGLIRKRAVRAEMFIGGPRTRTYFHCANGGNLFTQVHGRKRWVLVPPQQTIWMSPIVGYGRGGTYFSSPVVSGRNEKFYPLYAKATKYVVTLSPGDVLYNPPWWWHEVSNLGESIGVPLRVPVLGSRENNNWLFTLLQAATPVTFSAIGQILKKYLDGSQRFKMDLDDAKVVEAVTPRTKR